MGVNHADVFAVVFRFDKALHDFFAFTAGEVTWLLTLKIVLALTFDEPGEKGE
ncbi:hypothetical protein S1U_4479 [Escherichia coli B83]|nr:hypothetical protein S1U_4479 [Escherichia coli B83]